eukprot:scaffold2262_cov262-Pinguiococcus_pyrenoidosus.AAC.14
MALGRRVRLVSILHTEDVDEHLVADLIEAEIAHVGQHGREQEGIGHEVRHAARKVRLRPSDPKASSLRGITTPGSLQTLLRRRLPERPLQGAHVFGRSGRRLGPAPPRSPALYPVTLAQPIRPGSSCHKPRLGVCGAVFATQDEEAARAPVRSASEAVRCMGESNCAQRGMQHVVYVRRPILGPSRRAV